MAGRSLASVYHRVIWYFLPYCWNVAKALDNFTVSLHSADRLPAVGAVQENVSGISKAEGISIGHHDELQGITI